MINRIAATAAAVLLHALGGQSTAQAPEIELDVATLAVQHAIQYASENGAVGGLFGLDDRLLHSEADLPAGRARGPFAGVRDSAQQAALQNALGLVTGRVTTSLDCSRQREAGSSCTTSFLSGVVSLGRPTLEDGSVRINVLVRYRRPDEPPRIFRDHSAGYTILARQIEGTWVVHQVIPRFVS
jgi:hypothetical protein